MVIWSLDGLSWLVFSSFDLLKPVDDAVDAQRGYRGV
jgi:hypothetical protein